jgi:hypothetical protein
MNLEANKPEIEFVVSYDVKAGKTNRRDNRFDAVRELVKDPSLRVTEIAWKTGYNKGHVSRLRKEAMRQELCRGEIMSENKNAKTPTDGGAEFPITHSYLIQSGMSLRDYFAGKAIQALARPGNYFDATARQAYMIADAMLKARDR